LEIPTPDDTVQVHLRPGYMVPVQDYANDTYALLNSSLTLVAMRDENGFA